MPWESVPTKGVPAGGKCASSCREKGERTHCPLDKTPAQGSTQATCLCPHHSLCRSSPTGSATGQIPSGVLPSPLTPATCNLTICFPSSETQCQLFECSLPSTWPPPTPTSHQAWALPLCLPLLGGLGSLLLFSQVSSLRNFHNVLQTTHSSCASL